MSEDRRNKLKEIVLDLHEGSDIKKIRKKFADLIRNVSPEEIAEMEESLIAEGIPVEQVQKVCDVHVEVFQKSLEKQKGGSLLPGHPVHTFREENRALKTLLRKLKPLLKSVPKGNGTESFKDLLEEVKKLEIHYRRKENQLFPYLEKVDFTGPSNVMWGKDNEIRKMLKEFENAFKEEKWIDFKNRGRNLIGAVKRMIFMEEKILFPTSLKKLDDTAWAEIRKGEPEIGYAWVKPGNLWDPSVIYTGKEALPDSATGKAGTETKGGIALSEGRLTGEQINLLLTNLPLDITYVDKDDIVLYYSQGKERIFPRSPGVIGRKVHNCHPPGSVHIVEKILDSFKKKEKDKAEFWLQMQDRFIHIRYFPMYDESGTYQGVLEVSQDVTDVRALKGERRLLDW